MLVLSDELARKIFYAIDVDKSRKLIFISHLINLDFLDWDHFLEVMRSIRAKTLRDKIDLFIRVFLKRFVVIFNFRLQMITEMAS